MVSTIVVGELSHPRTSELLVRNYPKWWLNRTVCNKNKQACQLKCIFFFRKRMYRIYTCNVSNKPKPVLSSFISFHFSLFKVALTSGFKNKLPTPTVVFHGNLSRVPPQCHRLRRLLTIICPLIISNTASFPRAGRWGGGGLRFP